MSGPRVLLYGGTFDPIHDGHLRVAEDVADQLRMDRVVLVVAAAPPHKRHRQVTRFAHRLRMAALAAQDRPRFAVSDCEARREGPSYTLDTVRHFRAQLGPEARLFWLIGADTLGELPTWHRAGELLDECTIVTAARPGYDFALLSEQLEGISERQYNRLRTHVLRTCLVDISASSIRQRVRRGESIEHLVPVAVARYIAEQGLYRERPR